MKEERGRKDEGWRMKRLMLSCFALRLTDKQTDEQTFVTVEMLSWMKTDPLLVLWHNRADADGQEIIWSHFHNYK